MTMKPADIIGMRGNSGWATDLVLKATRGEISHVALVVCVEPLPIVIESVNPRVRTVPLDVAIADHSLVYLMKDLSLTPAEREDVVRAALRWSTYDYSFLNCAWPALDDLTKTRWFSQHLSSPNSPMCSWLVAESRKAIGKFFGQPAESTDPEDILRFAKQHPTIFEVLKLRDA